MQLTQDLEDEKINRSVMEHIILGVAHEINNPNSFVRMNAMTLKKMIGLIGPCLDEYEKNNPDEKFGPYLLHELRSKMVGLTESILEASVRIIAIADKLKQCSSFALSHANEISLAKVVNSVLGMHKFLVDGSTQVIFERDETNPYNILGFGLQLEQAFSILVTNACDAIAERYANQEGKNGILRVNIEEDINNVTLRFTDNGTGIDPETLEKIFTPYFTTKPQGVGDGLGLPLCMAIIDRHGGSLKVESTKGVGTSFIIVLPKKVNN